MIWFCIILLLQTILKWFRINVGLQEALWFFFNKIFSNTLWRCKVFALMVSVLFITSIRCQDRVNDYFCVCPAGYKGKNCSTNIDDCVTNGQPCKNGATCTDKVYTIIKSDQSQFIILLQIEALNLIFLQAFAIWYEQNQHTCISL